MSFERRSTEEQRQAIYELKVQGKSGREIARLCAMGVKGLEPFQISRDTANRIARAERELTEPSPLAQGDLAEATRVLVRRMITIVEKQLKRMERQRRPIDTMEFKRLTDSLVKLRKLAGDDLAQRGSSYGHEPEKQSLIEQLARQEGE